MFLSTKQQSDTPYIVSLLSSCRKDLHLRKPAATMKRNSFLLFFFCACCESNSSLSLSFSQWRRWIENLFIISHWSIAWLLFFFLQIFELANRCFFFMPLLVVDIMSSPLDLELNIFIAPLAFHRFFWILFVSLPKKKKPSKLLKCRECDYFFFSHYHHFFFYYLKVPIGAN
jgi:hypothetical protein